MTTEWEESVKCSNNGGLRIKAIKYKLDNLLVNYIH